jgi:histidyl-tRNA synthetase
VAEAPKTSGHLCDDCGDHYDEVKKALDRMNVHYEINDRLVRGLDYYNRTVFEYISDRLGAQDSLGGGGRYDYLVEDLGGPPTPSSGFALGIDRTMMAMPESPPLPEGTQPPRESLAYVVWMGESELGHAVELAAQLRAEGVATRVDFDAPKPKRQFKSADAAGAACCVIVGPDELAKGVYSLKDLATGEQEEVPANMIVPRVRALFR